MSEAPADGGAPLVLVLNAGSTGLKASLQGRAGACLWRDQRRWQELGIDRGPAAAANGAAPAALADDLAPGSAAGEALAAWLDQAVAGLAGLSGAAGAPALVAHRVVHGGERFTAPTRLDPAVLEALEALTPLAPLHNGPALALVRWARQRWPERPHWACFDTDVHADLPPETRTYAIPAAWRRQGLRRLAIARC